MTEVMIIIIIYNNNYEFLHKQISASFMPSFSLMSLIF